MSYVEDVITEYAAIIHDATVEHLAPFWTLDLIKHGLENPAWIRTMARRWAEDDFQPSDFASRVELLADAIEESVDILGDLAKGIKILEEEPYGPVRYALTPAEIKRGIGRQS